MKQLPIAKLPALFGELASAQKLYIPADDAAGQASFTVWQEGMELTKKLNTVRSAKDLLFPQVENLVGFRVTGKQLDLIETRDQTEPFVLFGVRACDARSFEILDKVFLAEPQDTYYASRRANGTIVTLACTRPEETCFCRSFGIDPAAPQGDVSCWMDEENLYWQANTEKGEALTAKLTALTDGGETAQLLWGFADGGKFTSEFPAHMMSHAARLKIDSQNHVVMHCHPANLLAMTYVHSLDEKAFTRTLWQMCTECIVVFPDGVNVLPWMLCGTNEIGEATAEKMRTARLVVWAQHGIYGAGKDLDETFGLIETAEKAAEIYMKIAHLPLVNTITDDQMHRLEAHFGVKAREGYLA